MEQQSDGNPKTKATRDGFHAVDSRNRTQILLPKWQKHQQNRFVKSQKHLTHCQATTYIWHLSLYRSDIMNAVDHEKKPRTVCVRGLSYLRGDCSKVNLLFGRLCE
jgi:hypothetical protein